MERIRNRLEIQKNSIEQRIEKDWVEDKLKKKKLLFKERTTDVFQLVNMRSNNLKKSGNFGANIVSRSYKVEVGGILSLKISEQKVIRQ